MELTKGKKIKRTAGNEQTSLLKLIAIALMIVDHVGAKLLPRVEELRLIGRFAFPLFAWCVVVGTEYTRNKWKYALRLLAVGLISQPVFMWALDHKWYEFNIFATLLLGLLAIAGIQEKKWGSHIWAPILCIFTACVIKIDYGWNGVLLILLLYSCRKDKWALFFGMLAFCLYWGRGTGMVSDFFGIRLPSTLSFMPYGSDLLGLIRRLQFWAVGALPLILIPMNMRFRMPKWIAYAAYPGHLLILGLIRHWHAVEQFFRGL